MGDRNLGEDASLESREEDGHPLPLENRGEMSLSPHEKKGTGRVGEAAET